ncbi:MAG: DUF2971 domain-containing protein [Clostridia bacterium]|nr:DUF2971 domain-containing protein [Clostridia bacterium]
MEEDKNELISQYENFQGQTSERYIDYAFQDKNSIYHYTSVEGLIGIITSGKIRFTEYSYLNDSTEGDYIFSVLKSMLNNKISYDKEFKDKIVEHIDKNDYYDVYPDKDMKYFISCFSLNSDSLPMWNYYSKTQGYNINFDFYDIKQEIKKIHIKYYPNVFFESYTVLYETEIQKEFLIEHLNYVYDVWKKEKSDFIISFMLNYLNSIKFAFKHPAFQQEQEVRFVYKVKKDFFESEIAKWGEESLIKVKNDYRIIFSEVPVIDVPFDKKFIQKICLSPLNKSEQARESLDSFLKRYGYNAKIEISKIPLKY